jgi:hypothetical protein
MSVISTVCLGTGATLSSRRESGRNRRYLLIHGILVRPLLQAKPKKREADVCGIDLQRPGLRKGVYCQAHSSILRVFLRKTSSPVKSHIGSMSASLKSLFTREGKTIASSQARRGPD